MSVRCVYQDCTNSSEHVSMFRFPVNDQERLLMWIRNSGNDHLLSLTNKELSRRYICEAHFRPINISIGFQRKRLLGPAVPVAYTKNETEPAPSTSTAVNQGLEDNFSTMEKQFFFDDVPSPETIKVKTPTKVYSRTTNKSVASNVMEEDETSQPKTPSVLGDPLDMPTPRLSRKCLHEQPKKRLSRRCIFQESNTDTPTTKKLKRSASRLLKKNRSQQSRINRLKSKISQTKSTDPLSGIHFRSEGSETLTKMQLRKEGARTPWTEKEKRLCLSFFYKSPAGYNFLRRQGIVLAPPSTIRRWLSKTNCLPGFNDDVFKNIKIRFEESSMQEKACVVAFDEMSIMEKLEYSKKYDFIEGFEDLGGNHRTNKPAKYALVFVARGLYSKWKLPVAYFLSNTNVKANTLQLLLRATINKLFQCGLLPKATVCDQMSTNQKIYKDLGATTKRPFFFCDGRKVFALFDVPHLVKNVRNNFLNGDFVLNGNEKVCFSDIVKTYELDQKSEKSRTLIKITEKHINPNSFEKMKVSLATQLFSNSVAAAIRTAKDLGQLNSETAYSTGNFVETVNNMFDGLNSSRRFEKNPYMSALTKDMTYARQALIKGKSVFENVKKITVKTNKKNETKTVLSRPPCFDGIVQSIEATLQLFDEEVTQEEVKYMMTSRLNQDVIENLFALIRQKGGCNRNPSAKVLRTIFRSILVNSFVKLPDTKNCLSDGQYFLEMQSTENQMSCDTSSHQEFTTQFADVDKRTNVTNEEIHVETERYFTDASTSVCMTSNDTKKITLETCSVTYFAGYLAKMCINKFNCHLCEKALLGEIDLTDEKQIFILRKSFKFLESVKLRSPSTSFYNFIDTVLEKFTVNFENMMHNRKLMEKLAIFLTREDDCFYEDDCKEHIEFVVRHLISVKVNYYCKSHKKNILEFKPHQKLRILKNK